MDIFAMLSHLAPVPSSAWILPCGALVTCIVHAVLTRRMDLLLSATVVVLFYLSGRFIPLVEIPDGVYKPLIYTMHLAFSTVASYVVLFFAALSLCHYVFVLMQGKNTTQKH